MLSTRIVCIIIIRCKPYITCTRCTRGILNYTYCRQVKLLRTAVVVVSYVYASKKINVFSTNPFNQFSVPKDRYSKTHAVNKRHMYGSRRRITTMIIIIIHTISRYCCLSTTHNPTIGGTSVSEHTLYYLTHILSVPI